MIIIESSRILSFSVVMGRIFKPTEYFFIKIFISHKRK